MSQAFKEASRLEGEDQEIEWQIRQFVDSDVPGMVALANEVADHYKLQESISEEELRARLTAPRSNPERQVIVVDGSHVDGVPGNMPAGYASAFYEDDEGLDERSYFLSVKVHPAAEGMGLERTIAKRLMDIVHEYQSDPSLPHRKNIKVKAWALEPSANMRALWPSIGLAEARQFWTMARPLNQPIDEPGLVEGVNIRPFNRPEDNEGARTAFDDSFSDHWDHHPTTSEDWEHWVNQPNVKADLSWLPEIDAEPGTFAGFCIVAISEADNEKRGVCEGWIDLLGTTRAWRRVGLGRALLLHGLHSLANAGMDAAILGVDSLSPTGANKLYESVGFRIRMREFGYAAPLEQVRV